MTKFIYDTTCTRDATFEPTFRYSSQLCPSSSTATIATGSVTFAAQTGLSVVVGQRVRASVTLPVDDPSVFVEGPVTAYSAGHITINVDTFGGLAGSSYSSWRLTAAVNLTGSTITAEMRFLPSSCAARSRNPVTLTVAIISATKGVFALYLNPTQTAALQLGDYKYQVLYTPASSSDKILVVSGTISVIDE